MAIVLWESFDDVSTTELAMKGWFLTEAGANTRISAGNRFDATNGGVMVCENSGATSIFGNFNKDGGSTELSAITVGWWMLLSGSGAGGIWSLWGSDLTAMFQLKVSNDQHLTFHTGAATAELMSAGSAVNLASWYYYEIRVEVSNNTGSICVMSINGEVVSTVAAGTDTKVDNANGEITGIQFGSRNTGDDHEWEFDDLVIYSTHGELSGGLSAAFIETTRVTGDGATSGWTTGESDKWSGLVSGGPAGGTGGTGSGFIEASSTNTLQTFVKSSLSAASNVSVYAVGIGIWHEKMDAGYKHIFPVILPSGTSATSHAMYTNVQPRHMTRYFAENPVGPASWALSEVDAMSVGVTIGTQ